MFLIRYFQSRPQLWHQKIISKGKDKDVGEGFRTSRRCIGECAIKSCPWFCPLKKNTKEIDQVKPSTRLSGKTSLRHSMRRQNAIWVLTTQEPLWPTEVQLANMEELGEKHRVRIWPRRKDIYAWRCPLKRDDKSELNILLFTVA